MQRDGSYDPAFQAMGHNMLSPNMTNTGTAFKTNVHRQKTRKWVEAKAANYDGDDWGDEDVDDDDIEPPMPSNVLPVLPKLQQHQFRYQQQQAEKLEMDTVKILPQGSRRNGGLQSDTTDLRSLNPTFEAPHVTNVESSGQLLVPSRSGLPNIVSSPIPSQMLSLAPLSPNTVTIVNTTDGSTPTSSIPVTASKPTAHPKPSCISSVTGTHSVSSDLYLNFPHHSITATPSQLLPTQHQPPVQSLTIGDTSTRLPSRITSLTGSGSFNTSQRLQPLTKLQSSSTDTHIVSSAKSEYRRLSEIKPREISRSANLDRVVTEGGAEDSHRSSTSPQLPDVARMSMFAVNFDSSFVAGLEDAPPLPSLPPFAVSKQDTQVTPIITMSEKLDTKLVSSVTDTLPTLSISQESTLPPLPPLTTSPTMAPVSLSTSFDNPSSDSPRNSSTSTHTESPIKESDRLREEIMQSLGPFSTLSPDDQTKPSRQSTRESNYLPSLYDDYWASTADVDDSRDHTVGLGLNNNSVVAPLVNSKITADGDKSRLEEKISVEPESLISSNSEKYVLKKSKTSGPELSGPKRFSWEAVLESPLSDIGELSTGPSSPSSKTSSPTSAGKHISDAQNTPEETHNGDTKSSSTLPPASASQVIRSMLDVSDVTSPTRSATTSTEATSQKDVCQSHEPDPNQPEISLSKCKETPVTELSLEDGKPSVPYNIVTFPAQTKDVFGSLPTTSATTIESSPSRVTEPIDLRQILHSSVSSERVKDMTEARDFYYKCNTGLSHWISSMISEYPEYRLESRVFSKSLAPALLTTHVVTVPPLSAGLGLELSTAPNTPYSPAIFDHSVPPPNPVTPSFTTSTSGGFRSSPGGSGLVSAFHIPTSANDLKQSSAKGKDFLLAAGKAGKGLLNKGKHKFRGEKDVKTTNLEMVDSEWPCKITTKPELYTHPLSDDQGTIIQCRQYLKSRSLSWPTLCLSRSYTEIHSDFGPARVLKISENPGLFKNNRSRSTSEPVLSTPGYRPHNGQDIHRSTEKGPLVNTSRNVKDLGARVCEDGIASRQQLSGSSTGFGANPTNQVQSCDIQSTEQSPSFDKPSLVRPSQSALTSSLFSLPLRTRQSASQHTVDHSFDLINPTLAHEITPVVMAMSHDNYDETHAHSISPFSPPLGHIRPDGWIEMSSQVDLPDIRPGVSNTSPIAHSPVSPIFKHDSLSHQVPKSTVASPPVTTTHDIISPASFVLPESLSRISYEAGLRSSPGAYDDINDSINGRNAALYSLIELEKNGSQSIKPDISNDSTLGQDALDSKGKECVLKTPVESSNTLDLWNDKTPVNRSTTGDHASPTSLFQSRRQSIATAVGSPASSSRGRTRRLSTQITIRTDLALPSMSPGPPPSLGNAGPSDRNMMPNSLMPSALVNNFLAPVSPAVEEFLRRAGHGWEVQESHLAEPLAFSRQRSVSPARQTPHELSSFDKEVGEHGVRPPSSDSSDCEDSNFNIAEKADESGIELPPLTNVNVSDKSPPNPVKAPQPSTVVFDDSRRVSRMFSMPLEAYRPSPPETMVTRASYSGIGGVSIQTMSNAVPDGPNSREPHPQKVRKQTSMFALRGSPAHMSSPVRRDNSPYHPQSFMPRPPSVNARHSNTHSGLRSATSPLGFGVMNSDSIPTPVNKSRFSGIANFFKRSNASSRPKASKRGGTFREASMSCADLPVSPYSQSLTNISRPMSQGPPLTQWELDTSEKRSSLFSRLTRPNSRSRPASATPDNRMYFNIIPTHSSQDSPYPSFYGDRPSSEARQSQTSLHLGRLPAASRSQGTLPATPGYRNSSQSIIATTSPRSSLGAYSSQFRASDQFPGHVRATSSTSDRNGRADLNGFMAGSPHVASGYTTTTVLPSPLSEPKSFAPSSHSASGNWATSLGSLHSPDQDIPHSALLNQNRFHTPASSTLSEHLHIGDPSTQLTTWLSNNQQIPNRGSKALDLPSKPTHKSLFTGFKRRSKDAGTCMASHTTSSFKFKPFSMKSRTGHTPIHHEHELQFQLSNPAAVDPLQHRAPSLIHNHSMPLLTNLQCGISNSTPDCLLVGQPLSPFCNRAIQHHIQSEHSPISHNSPTLYRQNTSSSPMHHYESVVSGSHCDPVTTPSAQNHVYVGTPYSPSSAHVFPSTSVNAPQYFASQSDGSESEMSMSATAYPGQEWVPYINPDESD